MLYGNNLKLDAVCLNLKKKYPERYKVAKFIFENVDKDWLTANYFDTFHDVCRLVFMENTAYHLIKAASSRSDILEVYYDYFSTDTPAFVARIGNNIYYSDVFLDIEDYAENTNLATYARAVVGNNTSIFETPETAPPIMLAFAEEAGFHVVSEMEDKKIIKEYAYKPKPIFFGKGPLYLGVELEIAFNGSDMVLDKIDALIEKIAFISINKKEPFYLKQDSTLGAQGFEIVCHPMDPIFHFQKFESGWGKVLDMLQESGLTEACDSKHTCGMHIHASKKALSNARQSFLCWMFDSRIKRRKELESVHNRKETKYAVFDSFDKCIFRQREGESYTDRYTAINFIPKDTVEFRAFTSTTDNAQFKQNLAFIALAIEYSAIADSMPLQYKHVLRQESNEYLQEREDWPDEMKRQHSIEDELLITTSLHSFFVWISTEAKRDIRLHPMINAIMPLQTSLFPFGLHPEPDTW